MDWKKELKTEQSKKIFEILMDKGADLETVINILRFVIPEESKQDKLLEIIKNDELMHPNGIIMEAIAIDEQENPEKYM